jgi:hypothetical protein
MAKRYGIKRQAVHRLFEQALESWPILEELFTEKRRAQQHGHE